MPRPTRTFTAESFELEGRLLLTARFPTTSTVPPPPPPPPVQFKSATSTVTLFGVGTPIQVVMQQAGKADVTLSRTNTVGTLQVEVKSDPVQPAASNGEATPVSRRLHLVTAGTFPDVVGAEVDTLDQVVTFADGQSQATLTVPIHAGAPNPGVVDVSLYIKSDLPTKMPDPRMSLDLKIVASEPTVPPRVVSMTPTTQGILLGFNKPMNPVGASDVRNYSVKYVTVGYDGTRVKSVPIQSAQYDPATQSVILVPTRPIPNFGGVFTSLILGPPAANSVRRGHRSNVAGSLTDLQGNPINTGGTPGKVELRHTYAPPQI